MRRWIVIMMMAMAPGLFIMFAGCDEPTTHVERRSERIEKSEPHTVSPGEPVVE